MYQRRLVALAAGAVLIIAACSSGGATTAPTGAPTAAPTTAPSPAATAAAACSPGSAAGEVAVGIEDFAFSPADISASVGQTVTFTNNDSAPHTATLDDGSCTTPSLSKGLAGGLTFNAAGTYPFHCAIHPSMKGTITVS